MGMNNQSRSLIIMSKRLGWDPTKCEGVDIGAFNVPSSVDNKAIPGEAGIGALPGGTPSGWPDGYDSEHPQVGPAQPAQTFASPDAGRETKNRATKGADPNVGGRTG